VANDQSGCGGQRAGSSTCSGARQPVYGLQSTSAQTQRLRTLARLEAVAGATLNRRHQRCVQGPISTFPRKRFPNPSFDAAAAPAPPMSNRPSLRRIPRGRFPGCCAGRALLADPPTGLYGHGSWPASRAGALSSLMPACRFLTRRALVFLLVLALRPASGMLWGAADASGGGSDRSDGWLLLLLWGGGAGHRLLAGSTAAARA